MIHNGQGGEGELEEEGKQRGEKTGQAIAKEAN